MMETADCEIRRLSLINVADFSTQLLCKSKNNYFCIDTINHTNLINFLTNEKIKSFGHHNGASNGLEFCIMLK